jgi:uncharacterized protein
MLGLVAPFPAAPGIARLVRKLDEERRMHERPILRLRSRHERLSREIEKEQGRRAPDGFRIVRLKKLKLSIKNRLVRPSAPCPSPN